MRKIIALVLIGFLVAMTVFAAIEKVNAEKLLADKLGNMKNDCVRMAGRLLNYRDTVQKHVNLLDTVDKNKLPALKTKVNAAISALNDIVDYVGTEWPKLD